LHRQRSISLRAGKTDFIEKIDDDCIRYNVGGVAANELVPYP